MIALELGSGGQEKEKTAAPKCELHIPTYCENRSVYACVLIHICRLLGNDIK
jgi:hypothetical protein